MANKFGVMAAPATGQIFVGRVNHSEQVFLEKVDKTDEVLCATRDHLAALIPEGQDCWGYEWEKDGVVTELIVKVREV